MTQIVRRPRASSQPYYGLPRADARTPAVTSLVIVAVVVGIFALSGGVLWFLGLNYDGLTGSPVSKIHPATYATVLLVLWLAFASGNPVGFAVRMARLRPASLLMLIVAVLLFLQTLLRKAPGLAGNIDTFAGPALLMMTFVDIDDKTLRRLEIALHLVMIANAGLGLYEFLSANLLFPYRLDGKTFEFDTRSAALQGHPLENASVTAFYIIALATGGADALPPFVRLPMIGLQLAALVTFGGRSASVVTLLLLGGTLLHGLWRVMRSRRIPLLGTGIVLILGALVPLGVIGLSAAGFFDKLMQRFVSDGGSANARVEMFDLFHQLPLRDLWFGPDIALVDSLRRVAGLEWGIENPIIAMIFYQGIVMTAIVAVAVVLFVVETARISRSGTLPIILAFLILINTSQSLAGKTTLLSKFLVMVVVLYRPVRQSVVARTAPRRGTTAARPAPALASRVFSPPSPR